jgi:hypothetical protein
MMTVLGFVLLVLPVALVAGVWAYLTHRERQPRATRPESRIP